MAGDSDSKIDLNDAYSVSSPQDNKQLYARWAETYDKEFLESYGYVYSRGVAELFARYASAGGPILDVGCGTGAVGVALAAQGLGAEIHGVDISPEMLAVAGRKTLPNGQPLYKDLAEADLTKPLDIESNTYSGGILSAGAFTHGHLGPECLDELLRVGAPGSTYAIGINSSHYIAHGFADYFDSKQKDDQVSKVEIVELAIYDAAEATVNDMEDFDAIAYAAIFINRSS